MSEELKPCPFCNSEATYGTACGEVWARCTECMSESPLCDSYTEARTAWNTRPSRTVAVSGQETIDAMVNASDGSNGLVYPSGIDQWSAKRILAAIKDGKIPDVGLSESKPVAVSAVTDEMVERACAVMDADALQGGAWTPQRCMRAAITAALSGGGEGAV